jgi:hypothetical protein
LSFNAKNKQKKPLTREKEVHLFIDLDLYDGIYIRGGQKRTTNVVNQYEVNATRKGWRKCEKCTVTSIIANEMRT